MSDRQNTPAKPERLYYLDWIRVLAMFGIFFFHNCRFYDSLADWHVKNATTNVAASGIVAFLSLFMMPLFFLVAGAGTYLAFRSRNSGQFITERAMRLLIPFIFGMLVIVVPQAYFQALYQGEDLSSYNVFQIYWLYLQTLPDINTFHLWFLLDLFIFSIIAVPLFFNFGSTKRSLITRLSGHLGRPWLLGIILLLSITLVNILVYPDGYWGNRNGGWNIIAYLIFFIAGYLIFANPRIVPAIARYRWVGLVAGAAAVLIIVFLLLDPLAEPAAHFGSAGFIMASVVQAVCVWGWILAIMGFSSRYLNFNNRFLAYSNEAVLPFYILHQTLIISIGYYVVQWNSGIGLKYLVIASASFIAIMLIYELVVRHLNILRLLFGMKWNRKPESDRSRVPRPPAA
jgi:glucans biosynthesis protein C